MTVLSMIPSAPPHGRVTPEGRRTRDLIGFLIATGNQIRRRSRAAHEKHRLVAIIITGAGVSISFTA